MNILIVEPYYAGSHKQWVDGLMKYSDHQCVLISLRGKYWKWRMSGGAISLANQFLELNYKPDLILCSDMLDLVLFKSLLNDSCNTPFWIYFHENQLTYPFQDKKAEDRHYGFINYTSALVADKVLFNSDYHRQTFLTAVKRFLKILPDERNLENVKLIKSKSSVLHLGLELSEVVGSQKGDLPVFLWNHRWEYDKNPELFFETLFKLKDLGYPFRLNVLGESFADAPEIFEIARVELSDQIDHWGYIDSKEGYNEILRKSNIVLVTSNQDFFGISVVEAIASGCYPILPSRLAFPEIIPFEEFFYCQDELIVDQVKNVLDTQSFLLSKPVLLEFVTRYHWQNCIHQYDAVFDKLD